MIRDLRRERERTEGFPKVILFFQGSPEQGAKYFRDRRPEAVAVADRVLWEQDFFHIGQRPDYGSIHAAFLGDPS